MQNKSALALGTVGGTIALAAQTKREDAMSNLSTWIPSLEGLENADLLATIFGFALLLIALVMYFRPGPKPDEPNTIAIEPKANGPNSPSFVGDANIFHFGAPPAPEQKPSEKEPSKSGYTADGMDNLLRAVSGYAPKPDTPLNALFSRVYKKLGGAPKDPTAKAEFYHRVDREIANSIKLNGASVWGHYMRRPIERIKPSAWNSGEFDHKKNSLSIPGDSLRPFVYKDLYFNKAEIDEIWPRN